MVDFGFVLNDTISLRQPEMERGMRSSAT